MRHQSVLAGILAGLMLFVPLTSAQAGPKDDKHKKPRVMVDKGKAYCFERTVTRGSTVIAGGKCHTFYLVRTASGSFLGFGPPGPPMIPPGQIVRMSTPAGKKLKGRLFHLVPIAVAVTAIPVDTFQVINVQVAPEPGRVVIILPRTIGTASSEREFELPMLQR